MKTYKAQKITVVGRVQGVGFRPFVFSLAKQNSIKGTVQNNMDGVKIFAEGTTAALSSFIEQLQNNHPRLARVDKLSVEEVDFCDYQSFTIVESDRDGKSSLVIPIDASVCPECLAEMEDEENFRNNYPFINCTQCGPRYTIIKELPYDRIFTTMAEFDMCAQCRSEYEDPLNRRHHAQPIACPNCGPSVTLLSIQGEVINKGESAVEHAKKLLAQGKIIAVKGIGGFHLACDATNDKAIAFLRTRKNRPMRPLAVMANNLDTVEEVATFNEAEKSLLLSPESPIVVLKKKTNDIIPECIAPGMRTIGVLLSYTPLHKLLFTNSDFKMLVMTSANPSGLPMLYNDQEAYHYLKDIADFVLTSNRKIEHPMDDSVVQVINNELQFFRRARGYVPDPFFTEHLVNGVIALGPQQKNTFAIGRHDQIFIGPHIGDMGSTEVTDHFLVELNHLMKWLGNKRKIIVVDKHPNYETSRLAKEMDYDHMMEVQHHHAHHVACMADNQLTDHCFGIILDGTGYGDDGNIWGFELLYGDASAYERLGHLSYWPLPGGEKAVKEPWRNAVALMVTEYEGAYEWVNSNFPDKKREIKIIQEMIKKQINSPLAGTCGRLFDAVSALLGICRVSTYNGEAAIRLSELIDETDWIDEYYPFDLVVHQGLQQITLKAMLTDLIGDIDKQIELKTIALKFHRTIVEMCLTLLINAVKKQPDLNKKVVLSGGSFHNRFLVYHLSKQLEENGFQVYTHKKVPCNDGGISLGQLIVASTVNKQ